MIMMRPKLCNQFRLTFVHKGKEIEELAIQAVHVDPIRYAPGLTRYPVIVVFEDDIDNLVFKALGRIWGESVDIKLLVLDTSHTPIMMWMLGGGNMQSLTHGPFDYAITKGLLVQSEFLCRTAILKMMR